VTYHLKEETLPTLQTYHQDQNSGLSWPTIFTLPAWIQTWWNTLAPDSATLAIRSAWSGDELLGIAPLYIEGSTAYLLGSVDVCDYLDFITLPGREEDFFGALLPYLAEAGIKRLELASQRPEAAVFKGFFASENFERFSGEFKRENESAEIALPETWEDYLNLLSKKQRHEVRRKLRKLENETESFKYKVIGNDTSQAEADVTTFFPRFLELFRENPDKEDFLTGTMEGYFAALVEATATAGLARFGLLEIDGQLAAMVLYFNYQGRYYLYNSGYRSDYRPLSAGLISKILCIKEGIESHRQIFDFLKGPEIYKARLGGTTIPIYTATIKIS
jgi:CelD/BcsL family acetyltransferase involved in cellulose biosynthesis